MNQEEWVQAAVNHFFKLAVFRSFEMTNYVMCQGTACNNKESCVRYTQQPLPRYQAYLCQEVACKHPNEGCKWYVTDETVDK